MSPRLFDTRIRIMSGKGGVGKSTLALAVALTAARQGKRVLFCEVNPAESISRFLGQPPLSGTVRRVFDNVSMVALIPDEAVREYALLVLRFKALYNAVFENRVVRYFLRAVPSLSEFVMLGKLWFHEQERGSDGEPLYDFIVVDAPATGHLISWLRVPQVFIDILPGGPLKNSSQDFVEMLRDPARTRLDLVTVPEEMPVNEALDLDRAAHDFRLCTRGMTFINRVLPPLPLLPMFPPDAPTYLAPLVEVITARERWRVLGDQYLQKLPTNDLQQAIRITRRTLPVSSPEAISDIADDIERQLAAEEVGRA